VKTESGNLSQGRFAVSDPSADKDSLQLSLLEERELRAGESVTLRVQVSRASLDGQAPVPKARVVLKTLGTSFLPSSTFSITDKHGVAMIIASLPAFDSGRAAILLRAEADGEFAELRRIIQPV
ncbi:MAG TPA: hypothetical protein VHD88_05750, partial [Pyrinomonadaceae bacterium]|nr:hypothetical protein [Pyrinomonadaceae bacterium]